MMVGAATAGQLLIRDTGYTCVESLQDVSSLSSCLILTVSPSLQLSWPSNL